MQPIKLNYHLLDAVFFDFDGVLVDSVPIKTKAYQEIFKPYGQKAIELITSFHLENGGVDRYRKIEYVLTQLNQNQNLKDELANKFGNLVKKLVIESKPIEDILEIVLELNEKQIPAFIVSGTPEDELIQIVKERKWTHLFSGIFGSPMTKIEIVDKILKEKKINSVKCIFFGDANTDYKTALHHRMWYVGVPERS